MVVCFDLTHLEFVFGFHTLLHIGVPHELAYLKWHRLTVVRVEFSGRRFTVCCNHDMLTGLLIEAPLALQVSCRFRNVANIWK